eukprot:UN15914
MTHSFFKVQSKNKFRGFRGPVTHLFFKVQSQKNFVGGSRVYHRLKYISARFRGGFVTPCTNLELSRTLKKHDSIVKNHFCGFQAKK